MRWREKRGPDRPIASTIRAIVIACAASAPWVVALAIIAAGAASFFTISNFAIDTDASKLIASDVPWRQREIAFAKAFPQRNDLVAIVVDGATPELAEEASATLAARLSNLHGVLRRVWRPDAGPFFERHGLLFVEYLRLSFRWGGFPGYEGTGTAPAVLETMRAGLVEF